MAQPYVDRAVRLDLSEKQIFQLKQIKKQSASKVEEIQQQIDALYREIEKIEEADDNKFRAILQKDS